MTTDPRAVEEAVARLSAEIAPNDYHIVVIAVRRDDIETVLTALEERTAALTWIAPFADMRSKDDSKTFARVNRGALRTISERASSALGVRNEDR